MSSAAIYARFSAHSQSDTTIAVQLDACRAWCQSQNHTVVTEYIDRARSGTTSAGRDEYARMMADARSGRFGVLVVYRWDRFYRNLIQAARSIGELEALGIQIYSATEHNDRFIRNIMLSVADQFSLQLSERVRDAMAAAVRRGRRPGGGIPYGYQNGERGLEPHPAEAEAVRLMFGWYADGLGPRRIVPLLEEAGIPTRSGKPWSHSTLSKILDNSVYAGVLHWGDEEIPDAHEALVDPALFARLRARRRRNTRKGRGRNRGTHLLSVLLKCGQCGSSCICTGRIPSRPRRISRYRCGRRFEFGVDACPNASTFPQPETDANILALIRTAFSETRLLDARKAAIRTARTDTRETALKHELARLRTMQERYVRAIGAGRPPGALVAALGRVEEEIVRIEQEIEAHSRPIVPPMVDVQHEAARIARTIQAGNAGQIRDLLEEYCELFAGTDGKIHVRVRIYGQSFQYVL